MPLRHIPGIEAEYYLLSFDKYGAERQEADGSLGSDAVRAILADPANGITDVFLASHGWKGDIPAAIDQYDRWIGAMAAATGDVAIAHQARPGFKALAIGFHWPSLPWGKETLPEAGVLADSSPSAVDDTTTGTASIDQNVDLYAERIADTPAARTALRTILTAADQAGSGPLTLPPQVSEAYATLYAESGLTTGDIGAAPGNDYETWDPNALYQEALANPELVVPTAMPGLLGDGFVGSIREALLDPLRQVSFWKMKDRARQVGEIGGHSLLTKLQTAAAPTVRFHIMGHSFGCIVVSASIAGAQGSSPLPRPIDSLFLVQGALSLWSYCSDIPYEAGTGGYFHRLLANSLVRGPIVTTRSTFDKAVGGLYPKAAGSKRQLVLVDDDFPKYGGVGTFGLQGLGKTASDLPMQSATASYGFVPGRVYNIEASAVIKNGGGLSGAHSDIAHPEVAHVMWSAALGS